MCKVLTLMWIEKKAYKQLQLQRIQQSLHNRTDSRPEIANKLDNMADYDTVYNL